MEKLPYEVYDINVEKLENIIHMMLYENHIKGKNKVTNIQIIEMYLLTNKNECLSHTKGENQDPFLHIKLEVYFIPIINMGGTNKFIIHEDVKLALMKY